ncbi:MAG: hypothetical protein M1830_001081 [Pleopsidium flavum]|nr:MAG: hypothetical protein M1830_001081 [Pleopsidium flavum]
MPPHRTQHPPAAKPTRIHFDPWNSSATGHQRADNRLAGSTSWRQSRTTKLGHQFRGGAGGGKRVFDTVGAGSKDFGKDGRKENGGWEVDAPGLRESGWQDVRGLLGSGEKKVGVEKGVKSTARNEGEGVEVVKPKDEKKIFQGLCVYINGSTAPMASDHKLKYLLSENGASMSIALGRRSVTHVILGTPNGSSVRDGAGGGLAASKIQKEIKRVGGCGVKYVGVDWVLESIKAGKRLPEAQFSTMKIAAKGQQSVYGMFTKADGSASAKSAATATKDQDSSVL